MGHARLLSVDDARLANASAPRHHRREMFCPNCEGPLEQATTDIWGVRSGGRQVIWLSLYHCPACRRLFTEDRLEREADRRRELWSPPA